MCALHVLALSLQYFCRPQFLSVSAYIDNRSIDGALILVKSREKIKKENTRMIKFYWHADLGMC